VLSRSIPDLALAEQVKVAMQSLDFSSQAFKPVIYYKKELDLAEVLIADTSYTETQLTSEHYLAVFERNYHSRYNERHFVGFNLWVAKAACIQMGVEPVDRISMRRILKFLHEREDDQFVRDAIAEIMLPMLEEHNLDEFEIPA
jgi:hypothetical protein